MAEISRFDEDLGGARKAMSRLKERINAVNHHIEQRGKTREALLQLWTMTDPSEPQATSDGHPEKGEIPMPNVWTM